jgi:arylsulfatase A-like enzyme
MLRIAARRADLPSLQGNHQNGPACRRSAYRAASVGLLPRDITIAQALKPVGYAAGQFGNHLGDKNEYLPTNHGFDGFFGNLYHLNAEEEPEGPNYNALIEENPEVLKVYSPCGVIHSFADGKIEDAGSLTARRVKTVDNET